MLLSTGIQLLLKKLKIVDAKGCLHYFTHCYFIYFYFMPSLLFVLIKTIICIEIGEKSYVAADMSL